MINIFTVTQTVINSFLCPSSTAPSWNIQGTDAVLPNTKATGNNSFASVGSSLEFAGQQTGGPPNGPFSYVGTKGETLVLFGSEFGRLPTSQGEDGRDHNITGYPMWLAGVKPGFSYGASDEYGLHAIEGRMHTHDLHATLLALMDPDHEKLTYRYAGRDFRLTDVAGEVVSEIFA